MKFWMIVLVVTFGYFANAQKVELKGENYEVKGKTFLKNGEDVTNTLTLEKKNEIKAAVEKNKELEAAAKKREEEKKAVEKQQKATEKAHKEADKAASNYEKAKSNHNSAIKKYEKLKGQGKLSPVDEDKWLKKIDKLEKTQKKAEGRLK